MMIAHCRELESEAFEVSYMPVDGTTREHLFISYATEDWALAAWVTRRLTAEGYRVWCDRIKLLGGESYPKDIDKAIEGQTWRFIPLLSRFSKSKDNPLKERTKALKVGQALKIADFVIPLNVDGTDPDWMMTDLTYIPFHHGWAGGLRQLLEKLDSINSPRPLQNGRAIAIESFLPQDILSTRREWLYANCARFARIPSHVIRFSVDPPLLPEERRRVALEWPHRFVSSHELLAFQAPPRGLADGGVKQSGDPIPWVDAPSISGIDTGDLLADLLMKAVRHRASGRGLSENYDRRLYYYFPSGLCDDDKVSFELPAGGRTWVNTTGERTYRRLGVSQKYRYHLGAAFRVRRDVVPGYVLRIIPAFHITDTAGQPLPSRTVGSRRKQLGKTWWNYEWLNRHLAVLSFVANGEDPMILGGEPSDPLQLSSRFIRLDAPFGINEAALELQEPEPTAADADTDEDDEHDGNDDA